MKSKSAHINCALAKLQLKYDRLFQIASALETSAPAIIKASKVGYFSIPTAISVELETGVKVEEICNPKHANKFLAFRNNIKENK